MTVANSPKWSMRLTHEPTGLFVEVDSNHFRTQQKAKEVGLKLLKSKIKALTTPIYGNLHEDMLISYALPDDVYWPEDLQEYKEKQ